MKKLIFTLIITVSALFAISQAWEKNMVQEKVKNGKVDFFDYQKAFYDYCKIHNIKDGYYIRDGESKKLSGYKHFKRWEYKWEAEVDPITGAFPSMTAEDVIYAGNAWKSMGTKTAGEWENIGVEATDKRVGRVNCIAFHPFNEDIIYAGTPGGGLWRTINHGETWTPLTDHLPTMGVSAIVVVPNPGGDIIYIGTGDRDGSDSFSVGVLKSTDGGDTWNTTGLNYNLNEQRQVTCLVRHPVNPNILFATTTRGFYRTLNAGLEWKLLAGDEGDTAIFAGNLYDIELHPTNPNHIYVSTGRNADSAYIYRSMDMGETWDTIFEVEGCRIEMAVSPDKPNWMYAVVAIPIGLENPLEGVYKFVGGGSVHEKILDGNVLNLLGSLTTGDGGDTGQGNYDLAIAVDPNDGNKVFVGGINVWRSTTEIFTNDKDDWTWDSYHHVSKIWFSYKSYNTHADIHQLIFRPGTSELYKTNDGGIFKRLGNRNWESVSGGMVIGQIYRLGLNHSGVGNHELLAGLQDNGTWRKLESKWNRIHHSDGMECFIDYEQPKYQYACSQNGSIVRTNVAWKGIKPAYITKGLFGGFTNWTNGIDKEEEGAWVTPYILDPVDRETIYLGLKDVWKSDNQGNSWEKISNFGDSTVRTSIAVSINGATSSSPARFIFAAQGNRLNYTYDSGESWINAKDAPANISYICIKDADHPVKVWVSMTGYNEHGVYEYYFPTDEWINISEGLPQVPVYCVIQNKYNEVDEELYASTMTGIYRKVGCADWEWFSAGLPNVRVSELEIKYSIGFTPSGWEKIATLYAATYGRGMWKIKIEKADHRLWTGLISTEWNNPLNWEPNELPTEITNVCIPAGCPNWPEKGTLELGVDCNNLKVMENGEIHIIGYPGDIIIGEFKTLKGETNSKIYLTGQWSNSNNDENIMKGYGFLSDPGSEVIFTGQNHQPLTTSAGAETFQILTIEKVWGDAYFEPISNIIVNELCNVNSGKWIDAGSLHHSMNGDLIISYVASFNCPGILEFSGENNQIFSFLTNLYEHDLFNYLGAVKINAVDVNQPCDLTGNKKINNGLDVTQGIYRVGSSYSTEASGIIVRDGGTLILDKGFLYVGGMEVMQGGLLQSYGIGSDHAGITKLTGGIDYNFLIHGTIDAIYTDFAGTNQFGVHIAPNGVILKLDSCSFTSTTPIPDAALLRINNDQYISLNTLTFNYIPDHHRTVTKTMDQGEVNIYVYNSPSQTRELDPYTRINWFEYPPSKTVITDATVTSSENDPAELIRIYPNPSSEVFVIENDNIREKAMYYRITDLTGQTVDSGELPAGKTTIQSGNFAQGTYLLNIEMEDQRLVKKIVIN